MKAKITQYVTLGVMLLLIVLIVSLYPAHNGQKLTSKALNSSSVSSRSAGIPTSATRAD